MGMRQIKSGDVLVLEGKTLKGKNRIREHGDHWLVREVDRSVLSPNLGYLICPASYVGTKHLDPKYDRSGSLHQVDGYCRWLRRNDPDFGISGFGETLEAEKEGFEPSIPETWHFARFHPSSGMDKP